MVSTSFNKKVVVSKFRKIWKLKNRISNYSYIRTIREDFLGKHVYVDNDFAIIDYPQQQKLFSLIKA